MDVNFFELKFLITDSFYSQVLKNGYSYEQASGICYESFFEYVNCNSIESVIAVSTIIRLKTRHKLQLTKYDIENMKKILELLNVLHLDKILNDSESGYLEEDIQIIEYQFKELR
ncbi:MULTISPECIES: hypothetical protein [unclassified Bacillus (in: firmicutes)]|uniref:hypothetical protein n=1 Tax=unclassified Bacillus (in: firmicutes) TaxID=185979 RepID=UPI0008E29F57|nr:MULTISPECIES: hypothetical protein [unclassified Bacillus (in: firmicutes)]SFK09781.1 hypothetical protein SAMN04488574_1556 [Bacillus sp. 71mf]SFT22408.1 hypothetical protein SAMN04488145_12424 [Bacillus sp. 103mf]